MEKSIQSEKFIELAVENIAKTHHNNQKKLLI